MYRIYSKTKRMLNEEEQGESRVRENRTHGLVDEAEPISRNSLMLRGFTLIELMMAMAVFTIIAMIMMRFFNSSQQIWNKVSQRNEIYADARIALDLITRDLQCAFYNNDNSTKGIYPFWFQNIKIVNNARYYSDNNFKWTALNFIAATSVKENGAASSICELRYTFVPLGEIYKNADGNDLDEGWLIRSCTGDVATNDKYNFDLCPNSTPDLARMNRIWINRNPLSTVPDPPTVGIINPSFENFQYVIPHVYKLKFTCYSYNLAPDVYDPAINYSIGDAVTLAGKIYLSKKDSNIGINPLSPAPSWWGAVSAYDAAGNYPAGDLVTYNGSLYISKQINNNNKIPSDNGDWWQLCLVGFAPKDVSSQLGTYFPLAVKVDISLMSSSDWERWRLVLNKAPSNPTPADIEEAKGIRDRSLRTFSKLIYISNKASL